MKGGGSREVSLSIVSRIAHQNRKRGEPAEPLRLQLPRDPYEKLLHGAEPWWDALPLDFAGHEERFELGLVDRLKVDLTAASDVVLRTLGACIAGSLAFPVGYHPGRMKEAVRSGDLYAPIARRGDASGFFHRPPRGVRVDAAPASRPLFRPSDGECEDLQFESPFSPLDASVRARYLAHDRNRIAHARYWRHHDGPRPTLMAIHGFSADLYHLNEWFFALPWFYKMGCDVLLFTLPFHGRRQGRFSPFSGHGFFAGGAGQLNEALGQAVYDFRIFVDWLESRGVPQVGLTGVSLGGFTSALIATIEDRLKFVVPNTPVVSIADLVMEWEPIGAAVRLSLKAAKRSLRDARELLAVSCPLTYRPVVPRERLMIVGGVGDRLAPPSHAVLLWEHWERCAMHWFPGSHLIHLDRGDYLKQMARFLSAIDFLPPRAR